MKTSVFRFSMVPRLLLGATILLFLTSPITCMTVDSSRLRAASLVQPSPEIQVPTVDSQRQKERRDWVEKSVHYYAGVMRGAAGLSSPSYNDKEHLTRALQYYFARHKIKTGAPTMPSESFVSSLTKASWIWTAPIQR
jgi:hypothetical protein